MSFGDLIAKWVKPKNYASKNSLRAYWAEFTAMFYFLFVSVGTVVGAAMTATFNGVNLISGLKNRALPPDQQIKPEFRGYTPTADNAMILEVAFAFGVCIMCFVYAVGHISGGHFNPAVTFSTVLWGQMNPIKGVIYIAVQMGGATCGALAIKGLANADYARVVNYGANGVAEGISVGQAFGLELVGTAALLFVVYGTAVDPKATHIVTHMAPVAIGFTVFLAHLFLIAPTGCGINPARVFGSAVISGVWDNQWLYWVGPFVGGPLGAALHYFPLQWGDADLGDAKAVNIAGTDQEDKLEEQVEGVKNADANAGDAVVGGADGGDANGTQEA